MTFVAWELFAFVALAALLGWLKTRNGDSPATDGRAKLCAIMSGMCVIYGGACAFVDPPAGAAIAAMAPIYFTLSGYIRGRISVLSESDSDCTNHSLKNP
jgi:hypothetical protein